MTTKGEQHHEIRNQGITEASRSHRLGVTKFLAKMGAIYMGYNPNAEKEEQEERDREEAQHQKEREEYERFLNSLTPNERKIYEELQSVKRSNRCLQDSLETMTGENEQLRSRIRSLESND